MAWGLVLVGCATLEASEMELTALTDPSRIELLAGLEQLCISTRDQPYYVKIFLAYEQGECDGTPETCPKVGLYVTAATFDEAPDVSVFLLKGAYGWEFVRWTDPPAGASGSDFVGAILKRKVVSSNLAKQWFESELVQLKVNPWSGSIEPVELRAGGNPGSDSD